MQRVRSVTGGRQLHGLGANAVIEPPWPVEGRTTAVGRNRKSLGALTRGMSDLLDVVLEVMLPLIRSEPWIGQQDFTYAL